MNKIPEKEILADEENGFFIYLFKLNPNEEIPFHKHKTTKYNYILKGSMFSISKDKNDSKEIKEGELNVNKKGSEHSVKAGPNGCEFLVIWQE
ncbi:hypothetical protein HYW76_02115 [Candidatus Pacearchaeota archaeon]|nr:hypothetical protein [Candidatus Pacearchaeota archaeon]